jgi:hypothetical protein
VVLCALRGKFALEPYRCGLLLTHPRPLAEDSPSDFLWAPEIQTAATTVRTSSG